MITALVATATRSNGAGVSYTVESGTDWGALAPALLLVVAIVAVIGGIVALNLWAQRRRHRGEEAASSNVDSAGTTVFWSPWGK